MHRPGRGLRILESNESRQLLAMVEAEVGSLFELLPAPVLVTTEAGIVLRANSAAAVALGVTTESLVGKLIGDLLGQLGVSVRVRTLCHSGEVLRLYVL